MVFHLNFIDKNYFIIQKSCQTHSKSQCYSKERNEKGGVKWPEYHGESPPESAEGGGIIIENNWKKDDDEATQNQF